MAGPNPTSDNRTKVQAEKQSSIKDSVAHAKTDSSSPFDFQDDPFAVNQEATLPVRQSSLPERIELRHSEFPKEVTQALSNSDLPELQTAAYATRLSKLCSELALKLKPLRYEPGPEQTRLLGQIKDQLTDLLGHLPQPDLAQTQSEPNPVWLPNEYSEYQTLLRNLDREVGPYRYAAPRVYQELAKTALQAEALSEKTLASLSQDNRKLPDTLLNYLKTKEQTSNSLPPQLSSVSYRPQHGLEWTDSLILAAKLVDDIAQIDHNLGRMATKRQELTSANANEELEQLSAAEMNYRLRVLDQLRETQSQISERQHTLANELLSSLSASQLAGLINASRRNIDANEARVIKHLVNPDTEQKPLALYIHEFLDDDRRPLKCPTEPDEASTALLSELTQRLEPLYTFDENAARTEANLFNIRLGGEEVFNEIKATSIALASALENERKARSEEERLSELSLAYASNQDPIALQKLAACGYFKDTTLPLAATEASYPDYSKTEVRQQIRRFRAAAELLRTTKYFDTHSDTPEIAAAKAFVDVEGILERIGDSPELIRLRNDLEALHENLRNTIRRPEQALMLLRKSARKQLVLMEREMSYLTEPERQERLREALRLVGSDPGNRELAIFAKTFENSHLTIAGRTRLSELSRLKQEQQERWDAQTEAQTQEPEKEKPRVVLVSDSSASQGLPETSAEQPAPSKDALKDYHHEEDRLKLIPGALGLGALYTTHSVQFEVKRLELAEANTVSHGLQSLLSSVQSERKQAIRDILEETPQNTRNSLTAGAALWAEDLSLDPAVVSQLSAENESRGTPNKETRQSLLLLNQAAQPYTLLEEGLQAALERIDSHNSDPEIVRESLSDISNAFNQIFTEHKERLSFSDVQSFATLLPELCEKNPDGRIYQNGFAHNSFLKNIPILQSNAFENSHRSSAELNPFTLRWEAAKQLKDIATELEAPSSEPDPAYSIAKAQAKVRALVEGLAAREAYAQYSQQDGDCPPEYAELRNDLEALSEELMRVSRDTKTAVRLLDLNAKALKEDLVSLELSFLGANERHGCLIELESLIERYPNDSQLKQLKGFIESSHQALLKKEQN